MRKVRHRKGKKDKMPAVKTDQCELLVIGQGLAGLAAALFASSRGVSTIQVGRTGGLVFSSGLMDLLGIHPVEEQRAWSNPWEGVKALCRDIPHHPYAYTTQARIRAAFDEIFVALEKEGLPYVRGQALNMDTPTPLGTVRSAYAMPWSMRAGVDALRRKAPCLVLDFEGLIDFSAQQIKATMGQAWPALRAGRVPFPGAFSSSELVTGDVLAQQLESPKNRDLLVQAITPLLGHAEVLGMPAVLGLSRHHEVVQDLERRFDVPLFEIPTMPVSVPGLRLRDALTRAIQANGGRQLAQHRVIEVRPVNDGTFRLGIGYRDVDQEVHARAVILATGRFAGGGLRADRRGIRETLFDLPVKQPESRETWHGKVFLGVKGHPVNRAGLEVDNRFRPLNRHGGPAFRRLFAAGSILAHQDWVRMKCGAGVALASAYAAVRHALSEA